MLTFTSGAAFQLKQLLGNMETKKTDWQAYLLRTSAVGKGITRKEAHKVAFNIIQPFIKEHDGAVFFCEDGDIVVLFPADIASSMEEMTYQLHYLFTESLHDTLHHPFIELFDLSIQLEALISVAEQKVQQTLKTQEDANENRIAKDAQDNTAFEDEKRLFGAALGKRLQRKTKTILVVEDDPLSLRLVRNVLQNEFTMLTAETGQEAYESYVRHAPDIVFLDIGLPDTSGLQVLKKIIALDTSASIVMLSGHTYQDAIMQAMKSGARGFVGKPFTRDRLIRYIQNAA